MRKALVIGIDNYCHISNLTGAVNDAQRISETLSRNEDGSPNFSVRLIEGKTDNEIVTRKQIRELTESLFKDGDGDIAFFYFAGHGYLETTGGFLCAGDTQTGDDGLSLYEIMNFANQSKFRHRIVILDSCYSGIAGSRIEPQSISEISDGVTILTASTANQYSNEENGAGVFTTLFLDALSGGAANIVGDITPGSVYAHIDQSLGPWAQRPVFKTNVNKFVSLRRTNPYLSLSELREICDLFPYFGYRFQLDPTFEPERIDYQQSIYPDPIEKNTEIFSILQKYNRVGLLIPENTPHMWHAAMQSDTIRLTPLGEHYRRLASEKLI